MRAPQAASSRFTSAPYVLVAPLALVLVVFFGIPLALVVVVSFFVVNKSLMALGLADHPLEFLLFSDFSVVIACVHLFSLFMIVPIFNSMARIERAVIEAAVDGGASRFRVITDIVIPLSRTGIALGSIFVIALVMGDFFVVKVMSGGQSASVVAAMSNEIAILQYPPAAANAVCLLTIVTLMVAVIMRVVDVRRELSG